MRWYKYFKALMIFVLMACVQQNHIKGKSKVILKKADFLRMNLALDYNSPSEVLLNGSLQNIGDSPFYFYKGVLPDSSNMERLFSIFHTESLDQVHFIGTKNEKYLYDAKDDDIGVVVPTINESALFKLEPKAIYYFQFNLAKSYDFANVKKGVYALTFSVEVPAIDSLKHVYEIDPIDGKSKPVYYYLDLPFDSAHGYNRHYFEVGH